MTEERAIGFIQQAVRKDGFQLTIHAADEILDEDISVSEVREAIFGGIIIEDYPGHRRGPCCLIYGKTKGGRGIHVVLTKDKVPVRIITVYKPRQPYWVTPTERGTRP